MRQNIEIMILATLLAILSTLPGHAWGQSDTGVPGAAPAATTHAAAPEEHEGVDKLFLLSQ